MMIQSLFRYLSVLALLSFTIAAQAADPEPGKVLRAGIIGLDTSHVIAFTKVLNDAKATGAMAKVKIVAGFPAGTDISASKDRVKKYTEQLRGMGLEIVDSIPALLAKVDVVLLESVDGRPHLEQVIPVLKVGKPVFIDKPLAGTLADAIAIDQLAKKYKTPWFSSSSLRFSPGILEYRMEHAKIGKIIGCAAWGPCPTEKTHPDLFWYGVHGVETLFTIMGPGCVQVTRVRTDGAELVTGVWADGRIGTFRGIRAGKSGYGAMVFGSKGISPSGGYGGYKPLVEKIAQFFLDKKPAVDHAETLEIFAFMEAADESKRQGGKAVSIKDVMDKAREAAKKRIAKLDP
jgi:hypothetical protein